LKGEDDTVPKGGGYDVTLEDLHYTFDKNFLEAFSTGWHSQAEVESKIAPTHEKKKIFKILK